MKKVPGRMRCCCCAFNEIEVEMVKEGKPERINKRARAPIVRVINDPQ